MLRTLLLLLLSTVLLTSSVWAVLALYFQQAWGTLPRLLLMAGWCLALMVLMALLWSGRPWLVLLVYGLMFAALLAWWHTLKPSSERDWADDLAHITTGEVQGDRLTLHNVRNFEWRTPEDYDIRWESREYDLSRLHSVDMITSYWGRRAIAHVLVSFGFDDGQFVVFSVEIRRERGEEFSEIGGFFKQFELSIIATDERDAVRVRTNVRDEDAYLYRIGLNPRDGRALLLSFVDEANRLAAEPRFYHTISPNCTTLVFGMARKILPHLPRDYRLLLTGYLPEYIKQLDGLEKGYDLEELRQRGRITERAIQAGSDPDFSRLIRRGVPGWDQAPDE